MWKPVQVNYLDIPVTKGKFQIDLAMYLPSRMHITDCMSCELLDNNLNPLAPKATRRHFQEHPTQAIHEVLYWNTERVEAQVDYRTNQLGLTVHSHPSVAFTGYVRLSFKIGRAKPEEPIIESAPGNKRALIELKVLECVKDPITFIEHAIIHNIIYVGCYDGSGSFCKDLVVKSSSSVDALIAFDIYKQVEGKLTPFAYLVFNRALGTFIIEKFAYGMTHLKLAFEVEHTAK